MSCATISNEETLEECRITSPMKKVLSYRRGYVAGSLGPPLMTCQVKVVDVPEMNYKATDKTEGKLTPRGELCVKGSIVTRGYFKDPEKTRETIDDEGWLHTGDIAVLLDTGQLKIIDRKKNIFKLQQGEYVAPEKIENGLANTKWVAQIFVHGDSTQTYIIAVIYPKKEAVVEWGKEKHIEGSFEELCTNPQLNAEVLADLTANSKRLNFTGFEMIKKVHITPTMFTIENGTLTPTMKIKRHDARLMYADTIAKMYAEPLVESKPEVKKE